MISQGLHDMFQDDTIDMFQDDSITPELSD